MTDHRFDARAEKFSDEWLGYKIEGDNAVALAHEVGILMAEAYRECASDRASDALRVAALKAQSALNELMGDSSAYAWDDDSVFGDALRHLNTALAEPEGIACQSCGGTGSIPNGTDEMACGVCGASGKKGVKS